MAIARSGSDTALEGGDMGWRKAAQLPPPFDRMLSEMPVGEVTPPVRTPGGFIILKLNGKRGGETVVVDEVHVRHILIKPSEIRSEAQTKELINKIYDGSADKLFAALLGRKKLSEEQIEKLKQIVGDLE